MVGSFKQALLFALLTISVVLLAVLRSVPFTVLILLPLGMTVLLILSFVAWSGLSLNMANILVVPLIFGLGVDNGIHVVDRYLGERNNAQLMFSSTPRAVLLSSLTTIMLCCPLFVAPCGYRFDRPFARCRHRPPATSYPLSGSSLYCRPGHGRHDCLRPLVTLWLGLGASLRLWILIAHGSDIPPIRAFDFLLGAANDLQAFALVAAL